MFIQTYSDTIYFEPYNTLHATACPCTCPTSSQTLFKGIKCSSPTIMTSGAAQRSSNATSTNENFDAIING